MNGIHWRTCLWKHPARISCSIYKPDRCRRDLVAQVEAHSRVTNHSWQRFVLLPRRLFMFSSPGEKTHPTAGTQTQTSPSLGPMSKTPDRHRREGPATSGARQGLLSGGPWPDQVHRAPGPSTSCPKAGGALPVTVTPQSPWSVGSSAAGCVVGLLWITFTVIAQPQGLWAKPPPHLCPTQQTLPGSRSGWRPNPTRSPTNLPISSNTSASPRYCGFSVCNILF